MPFAISKIIHLTGVDSTNNYAAKLLSTSNPPEGTAIMAQYQTVGRGQRGNHWESEAGQNLLCSIILYPEFIAPSEHFSLSQLVALSICSTLEKIAEIQCRIKWPNDIIASDHKIAGILIENNWSGTKIQSSICGIGINLNQKRFNIPGASSLFLLSDRQFDAEETLNLLRKELWEKYHFIQKNGNESIQQAYLSKLYRINEKCEYTSGANAFQAIIRGIDEVGKLILEMEDGSLNKFSMQEVKMKY